MHCSSRIISYSGRRFVHIAENTDVFTHILPQGTLKRAELRRHHRFSALATALGSSDADPTLSSCRSVAHLIISTSHASHDSPTRKDKTPQQQWARTIHQLASLSFAESFSRASLSSSSVDLSIAKKLDSLLIASPSFGSRSAFLDELELAAQHVLGSNSIVWLVFNPHAQPTANGSAGALELLVLAGTTSPLSLGLFPLLSLNLSQELFLATPDEWMAMAQEEQNSSTAKETSSPPAWSREARLSREHADEMRQHRRDCFINDIAGRWQRPLGEQRALYIRSLLPRLNWMFAETQLLHALAWYSGVDRHNAQAKHRSAMEDQVRQHLKASTLGQRVEASGETTVSPPTTSEAKGEESKDRTGDAATSGKAATTDTSEGSEGVVSVVEADGSTRVTHTDGTIEQIAPDGNSRTLQRPNGEREFLTPGQDCERVIEYPDGSVCYFYINQSSIKRFPDDSFITTFPDGQQQRTEAP